MFRICFDKPRLESGVYAIRNVYNKKIYIGSSVQLKERWRQHKKHLENGTHHSPKLQNSWNKHGSDAFEFFVLSYCGIDELKDVEQYWIDSFPTSYNVERVARGNKRQTQTVPTKIKISMSVQKRWEDPEFRAKTVEKMRSAPRRGVRITAFGEDKSVAEFAEQYGISPQLLRFRLKTMSPEEALLMGAPK